MAAVAAAMAAASNKWSAARAKNVQGRRFFPPPATEAGEEEAAEEQEQREHEQARGQGRCPMGGSDAMIDPQPSSGGQGASAARGKKRARAESPLHVGMRVDARWSGLKTWYNAIPNPGPDASRLNPSRLNPNPNPTQVPGHGSQGARRRQRRRPVL